MTIFRALHTGMALLSIFPTNLMRLCCVPSLGTLFILITCIQIFGTYIFLKGFLLTRTTFEERGHSRTPWDRFPLSAPSSHQLPIIHPGPPFRRAILVVIDALRFDFATSHDNNDRHYLNKLPVIQHLMDKHSQSSLLYQFRADPPTTTMQRIKGLMTGSLPTFIDAGSNFASSAVQEDHLLHHIKNRYKSIYFMGDDTWVRLYPEVFDSQRTFESDSFKMLDLDSVDNDILSHLWPVVEDKENDWNLTIAHFLGVDHCGHTHGPSHPNMARKLSQMNDVIKRLLSQVDKDTLLVVMGDHGMSPEGDHGGESLEELMSTLFIHSQRPLVQPDAYYQQLSTRIHDARSKRLGYDLQSISERLDYDASRYPVVAQIHLVPTLAYLLQVPIPFGNLGAILPDVLVPEEIMDNKIRSLIYMIGQFRTNALQVYDYLTYYSQTTQQLDFSPELLEPIVQKIYTADGLLHDLASQSLFIESVSNSSDLSADQLEGFQAQLEHILLCYDAFLTSTLQYCESIWAHFDAGSMMLGILLLGLGLCLSVWLMISVYQAKFSPALLLIPLFTVSAAAMLYSPLFEKMTTADWIGVLLLTSVGIVLWSVFGQCVLLFDKTLVLLIGLIQSLTLGSNSYVVWEDNGTHYILSTLVIIWIIQQGSRASALTELIRSVQAPLLFLIVVRLSSMVGQCREEQFPYCQYTPDVLSFDGQLQTFFSVAFIIVVSGLVVYLSVFLKHKLSDKVLVRRVYELSCTVVILRIGQDMYQNTHEASRIIPKVVSQWIDVYLPRLVYILCLFCTLYVLYRKSYISSQKSWSILFIWSATLAMLQRPLSSLIILGSTWAISLLDGDPSNLLLRLTILQYYGHHLFFATGHQATFTSLPWKAAFVGFDQMNYYGGMVLVTLSTFAGYLISWLGWPILSQTLSKNEARQPLYLLMLMQTIPTFMCAIFVFVLRRHLMTWKIFAPRFLFQTLLNIGAHMAAILLERRL